MALTNPSIDVASLYYFSRKLEEVLNASLFYARELERVVSHWAVSPPPPHLPSWPRLTVMRFGCF